MYKNGFAVALKCSDLTAGMYILNMGKIGERRIQRKSRGGEREKVRAG